MGRGEASGKSLRTWQERVNRQFPRFFRPASQAHEPSDGVTTVRGELWLATSPNPTYGDLDISFRMPEASPVRLSVHDVTGRLVKLCLRGALEAGEYRQHVDLAGAETGIYFCNLSTKYGVVRSAIVLVR